MVTNFDNPVLYITNPPLLVGTGACTYILEINKLIKNAKVLSIKEKNNLKLKENEFNLSAKTWLNELLYAPINNILTALKLIKSSSIIHFNPFTLSEILLSLISKIYGKKIVTTYHSNLILDSPSFNLIRIFENIRRIFVYNSFLLVSDKIVFITNSQKEIFSKKCPFRDILNKKSVTINNFISEEYIIKKKRSNSKRLNILFVGRLEKKKGVHDLISVTELLNRESILFNIIGSGELEKKINASKNINLIGRVDRDKILRYYDKSKILILPSYTEVFPLTILEAMARGLVILVSDIPGMREIVREGRNGYLFPPGDLNKMKELIICLKNNPKEIERISKNNLRDVWKFTLRRQIPKYVKLYNSILK